MVDEGIILAAERLRDDLEELRRSIRQRYSAMTRQVTADDLRAAAARAAERWLVEIAGDPIVAEVIGSAVIADLSVHFQRLLTFSERATVRSRYEGEVRSILKNYGVRVVLALKMPVAHVFHGTDTYHVFAIAKTWQRFREIDRSAFYIGRVWTLRNSLVSIVVMVAHQTVGMALPSKP